MKVSNWVALTGAVAIVVGTGAATPARVSAQDAETLVRAVDGIGRSARIGVTVEEADPDGKDAKSGVLVTTITPGGPADKAGIKAGDAITEFDGERVRSVLHFSRLVQESAPGRNLPAQVSRGGQRVTVNVTPERRALLDEFGMRLLATPRARMAVPPLPPAAPSAPRAPRPPALMPPDFPMEFIGRARNTGRLGVTIEDLDTQLAEYFGVKDGVLVKSVAEDSVAGKAGMKAGDVITAINGRRIYDSSDISRSLDRVETNGDLTVEVTRDRKTQTLKGKLEAADARSRPRTRV